jgi:hypothetical protein
MLNQLSGRASLSGLVGCKWVAMRPSNGRLDAHLLWTRMAPDFEFRGRVRRALPRNTRTGQCRCHFYPTIEKIEHFGFVLPKLELHTTISCVSLCCRGWPAPSKHALDIHVTADIALATVTSRALAACLRAASKARIANLRRDQARRS